ncbi:hypothetical protein MMC13_008369 [Lambiella insularis]|nr:hypothetical protein [Lambiella insularis]
MLFVLPFLLGAAFAFPTILTSPHAARGVADTGHRIVRDTAALAAPHVPSRECGTAPPGPHLLAAHAQLSSAAARSRTRRRRAPAKYTVNTYFHIVSTTDQAHLVTSGMIGAQFAALEAAYANSSLSFALRGTSVSVNNTWATDADDAGMKAALRQGNYSALNIYFQTNLSRTPATPGSAQLLGSCTLPTNVTYRPCATCRAVEFPAADYTSDGCNVLAGSMPGGHVSGYSQGQTAVHEVGHWFGLLHTFQDQSCAPGDAGDFIADTPQQGTPTSGCPTGKDSCPGQPGVDAIRNYMDYSSDACYTGFSAGQTDRMLNMYQTLRYTY